MTAISADLVKSLREKTGAGMMDCKKALVGSSGDMEKAIEYLRKSGITKAEKKAGRATNEGKIVSKISPDVAVLVEVLCETDFVAKNDKFEDFCNSLVTKIASSYQETGDLSAVVADGEKNSVTDLVAKVGENIQIRRVMRWRPEGQGASYIHAGGKIGVIVDVVDESDQDFLTDLCMHIAAFNPLYVSPDSVPAAVVEKEKEIAAAQPELQNKPDNIIEKILQGKVQKWYSENCLIKQPWLRNDKLSVEKAMKPEAKVKQFIRWQVGEEIGS